jgi:putative membrane protein
MKAILQNEKKATGIIIALSIIVPSLVAALMYFPSDILDLNLNFPLFHAVINGITAVLLLAGFLFIIRGKVNAHKAMMISAFSLSILFLVSYVLSKISNDPVPYGGEGIMRTVYFVILISHIILAAAIVPMALFTIYRAWMSDFKKHRKIAKWTFPIWFYVAITGVLVYLFMMPYY